MKFTRKILFSCLFFFTCAFFFAQNNVIDSLKLALKNAKHDTTRVQVFLGWGEEIYLSQPDSALVLWHKAITISETNLNEFPPSHKQYKVFGELLGAAFNNTGLVYKFKGDARKAMEYYEKSLIIRQKIGDKDGIPQSLNNIGVIYNLRGDVLKALDYYGRSLKMREENGDKKGVSYSLNNIAAIYKSQGDFPKALEYYDKILRIRRDIGDKNGIAQSLNNIGLVYDSQKDASKALDYYGRSLKIREEIGDKYGIAESLNNIGFVYKSFGDPSVTSSREDAIKSGINKALRYFSESLKKWEEIRAEEGIANTSSSIGGIYLNQKNYSKALEFCSNSMKVSLKLGYPVNIKSAAYNLWRVYNATGNYKLALENYELYIQMKDSINNEATRKAAIKQQLKYDYEKQTAADSVAHAKVSEVKNAQLAQQKAEISEKQNQQYALSGGLVLVLLFAGFIFNRFKVTQKQKAIIELKEKETRRQNEIILQQKLVVEEKQKEILDSIYYARRIQKSFITNEISMQKNLKRLMKP